ncbi:CotH kinase family protein [Salinibacterium soli]|uniref:CotH kinase family protein n=1 Tax=Antiquaquibacter soli TaxID=3064523 RepID=A0ABT9BV03_9MICO|nr:CotH kinase family protein [Protaetiibacter sp. WY-16]MDO7883616.1 CotH kinase family protein [Protaetiibacter sp. WY-16]
MTRSRLALAAAASVVLILTGCSTPAATTTPAEAPVSASAASATLWDSSVVHSIAIEVDESQLRAALQSYVDSGEKVWVSATVTIDGTVFENVGIKLKGNSSLRGISVDSAAEELPWLIRLDEFVDGQEYDGWTELVVRGNNSETSLNEAVALELLELTGLASEEAIAAEVSVNGASDLRLVIQNPGEEWDAAEFGTDGALYKAEAGGDYSYRGDDPDAYADVFDQEAGDDDLTPLIDFLEFVNTASDEEFASGLGDWLDVDAFATYLAFQEIVGNFDDIDGPGNNSYLRYDESTGLMTVVSWDLNLALGVSNGGPGGGPGGGEAGGPGDGGDRPADGDRPGGGGAGGMAGGPSQGNVLSERFLADDGFAALYESALAELRSTLVDSGAAQAALDEWVAVLGTQSLVDSATVQAEAASVAEAF